MKTSEIETGACPFCKKEWPVDEKGNCFCKDCGVSFCKVIFNTLVPEKRRSQMKIQEIERLVKAVGEWMKWHGYDYVPAHERRRESREELLNSYIPFDDCEFPLKIELPTPRVDIDFDVEVLLRELENLSTRMFCYGYPKTKEGWAYSIGNVRSEINHLVGQYKKMAQKVKCPKCDAEYAILDESGEVKCGKCGTVIWASFNKVEKSFATIKRLHGIVEEMDTEINCLKEQQDIAYKSLDAKSSRIAELETQLSQTIGANTNKARAITQLESENTNLQLSLTTELERNGQKEIRSLKDHLAIEKAKVIHKKKELAEAGDFLLEVTKDRNAKVREIARLVEENTGLLETIEDLTPHKQNDHMRGRLREAQAERDYQSSTVATLNAEIESLKDRLKTAGLRVEQLEETLRLKHEKLSGADGNWAEEVEKNRRLQDSLTTSINLANRRALNIQHDAEQDRLVFQEKLRVAKKENARLEGVIAGPVVELPPSKEEILEKANLALKDKIVECRRAIDNWRARDIETSRVTNELISNLVELQEKSAGFESDVDFYREQLRLTNKAYREKGEVVRLIAVEPCFAEGSVDDTLALHMLMPDTKFNPGTFIRICKE